MHVCAHVCVRIYLVCYVYMCGNIRYSLSIFDITLSIFRGEQIGSASFMGSTNSVTPKNVYEELLKNPPEDRRILSIQSHVVHGYAGNKCSIFPLQVTLYNLLLLEFNNLV